MIKGITFKLTLTPRSPMKWTSKLLFVVGALLGLALAPIATTLAQTTAQPINITLSQHAFQKQNPSGAYQLPAVMEGDQVIESGKMLQGMLENAETLSEDGAAVADARASFEAFLQDYYTNIRVNAANKAELVANFTQALEGHKQNLQNVLSAEGYAWVQQQNLVNLLP